jgi:hypothetical protein
LVVVVVLSVSWLNVALAAPVQWPTSQGGSGHYYDFVAGSYTWGGASMAADGSVYLGMPGYLATITSPAERSFLSAHFTRKYGDVPVGYLGGYQDNGAGDYAEPAGGWRWITGEPWIYTNWWTEVGFPDNYGGGQDYLRTQGRFLWDDVEHASSAGTVTGYYVEYAPIPESPVPGDFDGNGLLDLNDLHLLFGGIRDGNNFVFDLDPNSNLDHEDRRVWVEDLKGTYFGDADLDGEFGSGDLILVFQAGKFEDGKPHNASWEEGDWNGDTDFDSSDMVLAFAGGGYEAGPRLAAAAVPEPASALLLAGGLAILWPRRRSPHEVQAPASNLDRNLKCLPGTVSERRSNLRVNAETRIGPSRDGR